MCEEEYEDIELDPADVPLVAGIPGLNVSPAGGPKVGSPSRRARMPLPVLGLAPSQDTRSM